MNMVSIVTTSHFEDKWVCVVDVGARFSMKSTYDMLEDQLLKGEPSSSNELYLKLVITQMFLKVLLVFLCVSSLVIWVKYLL